MTSHNILVMSEAGSSPLLQGIICLFSLNKSIKKSVLFFIGNSYWHRYWYWSDYEWSHIESWELWVAVYWRSAPPISWLCLQCLWSDTVVWDSWLTLSTYPPPNTTHLTPIWFAHKHSHCVATAAPHGQCIACCWLSKSAPAQLNNGAKEAFSCRSTASASNTKVDDSAVRCPLSAVEHRSRAGSSSRGHTRWSVEWRPPAPVTAHSFLCRLQSRSKHGKGSRHAMSCLSVKVMIRMNCDQVCD